MQTVDFETRKLSKGALICTSELIAGGTRGEILKRLGKVGVFCSCGFVGFNLMGAFAGW